MPAARRAKRPCRDRESHDRDYAPRPRPDPALSVIIACRNGAATLAETLEGLAAQRWDRPWEVVLADNGSTDGSVALFEGFARAHAELRDAGRRRRGAARQALRAQHRDRRRPRAGGRLLRRRRRAGRGLARRHGRGARAPRDRRLPHRLRPAEPGLDPRGAGASCSRPGSSGWRSCPSSCTPAAAPWGCSAGWSTRSAASTRASTISRTPSSACAPSSPGIAIAFVPEAVMHVRARRRPRADLPPELQLGPLRDEARQPLPRPRRRLRRRLAALPRTWRRVLRHHLRKGLRPAPETMLNAAWLRAGAGRLERAARRHAALLGAALPRDRRVSLADRLLAAPSAPRRRADDRGRRGAELR